MKTTKKIMSVILTVMLVLSCLPMSVISVSAADNGVTIDLSTLTQDIIFGDNHSYSLDGRQTYMSYESAVTLTGKTEYSVILEDSTTSHDIILDNVTMTNKNNNGCISIGVGETLNLTVKGTNTLTQTGGNFGNSAPAIYLGELSTLNITEESTGVLNTTGGLFYPAIGGNTYFSELNINGGTINAIAGIDAAAIGYAANSYMSNPSYINIENAVVNATADSRGAAIGGGDTTRERGTCYITIKNSVVNARSDEAGIGSGYKDPSIYNIKIEDSYVKANGGLQGSGIGTGSGNANANTVLGDIEILNSVVYATGGTKAAGIGGSGGTSAGNIKITNSTVTAIGGDLASGIGRGSNAIVLESDKITIEGSNIRSKLYDDIPIDDIPIINSAGENVRLLTIVLDNAPATSLVTSISGVKGYEDVNIQTFDSILYIYVPEGSNPDKVIANGKEYVGTVVDGLGTFVYKHDCDFEENGSCEKCGTIYQKAVDSDGDGYVEIGNENQLNWFSRQVNIGDSSLNAILTDDIVVNEGTITAESANVTEWSPIGCYSNPYEGVFNGNNKTISGLYFNDEFAQNIGVFGYLESDCFIKNLTLSNSYFCGNKNVGGIVGYSDESTVDNCINNAEICGSENVGGIVGDNHSVIRPSYYSHVSNCTNNGKIYASKQAGGGIIGLNSAGEVENCFNTGEIQGINYIGGIIGDERFSIVTACGNEGEITGLYTDMDGAVYFGGIAGVSNQSMIIDSYNKGNISSFSETYHKGCVGGITGDANTVIIENCYNTGEIFATDLSDVGGIFGYSCECNITNCYNIADIKGTVQNSGGIGGQDYGYTIIEDCYNIGACTGTETTGGIIALCDSQTTVSNCYYLEGCATNESGTVKAGIGACYNEDYDLVNGVDVSGSTEAKTLTQFKSGEVTYLLNNGVTDRTQVWYQTLGTDDYPVFEGETVYSAYLSCNPTEKIYSNTELNSEVTDHNYENGFCTACDAYEPATDSDDDGYVEIDNGGKLYWFAQQVNSGNKSINAILTTDIVVNDGIMTAESTDARVWTPIGNKSEKYIGVFDGNNKTVSGLYFNDNTVDQVGLFGWIEGYAEIKNTGVINSYFNGGKRVGSVVALIDQYAAVKDCYNDASTVKGALSVGGVVGVVSKDSTLVENCYNTGNVYGDEDVGGIVGYAGGLVKNCYNTGNVYGDEIVGGIVGTSYNDVKFCYNAGSVKGNFCAGGIVGNNSFGINCCYNVGSVSCDNHVGGIVAFNFGEVKDNYNTGSVSGDIGVGGIFGENSNSLITNCYNVGSVSGNIAVGGVGGHSDDGEETNNYYLNSVCTGGISGEDVAGSAEAKTAKQFASGEVTYLLNNSVTDGTQVWYQTLGTDDYPVFEGETVYCIDGKIYSNSETIDEHKHNYDDGTCTICGELLAELKAGSLTLDGMIGVDLYIKFSDVVFVDENPVLTINVPQGTKESGTYELAYETLEFNVNDSDDFIEQEDELWIKFTCWISAKEMTAPIIAQLKLSDGTLSETMTYTVKQYADTIFDDAYGSTYDSQKDIVKSLLNYGAYAQQYFDYRTDELPNTGDYFTDEERNGLVISGEERTNLINDNAIVIDRGTEDKVKYYGSSLLLEDGTVIRHYFTLVDSSVDVSTLTVTIDGVSASLEKNGSLYYVEIKDVPAYSLDEKYTVCVDSVTIKYSCLSYVASALKNYTNESGACTNASKQNLVNLAASLYAYSKSAKSYAG